MINIERSDSSVAKTNRPELVKLCNEFKVPFILGPGWCRRTRATAKRTLKQSEYFEFMKRAYWESGINYLKLKQKRKSLEYFLMQDFFASYRVRPIFLKKFAC